MGVTPEQFVEAYIAEAAAGPPGAVMDIERSVLEPSGLDAAGMVEAISDTRLGRLGIPMIADFMAPTDSIYFDAIFGAYRGQAEIRAWLVPAMAEIEFVDFIPMAESVIFDDGEGGTSLDEWKMVANMGDVKIPLSRGVSVRRHRDGWLTWACDVYDTGAFRQPPPPEMAIEAAPLPPWPRVEWPTYDRPPAPPLNDSATKWVASRAAARSAGQSAAHEASGLSHQEMLAILTHPTTGGDAALTADLFHPTSAVFTDPLVGELCGQSAIRAGIAEVLSPLGNPAVEPLGPLLFDGTTAVQEWKLDQLRGTSVRRFADGWLVEATDYFDTAAFDDAD